MYDIKWVREQVDQLMEEGAGNIRVHPNGFVQVDLQPTEESWRKSHHEGHSGANLRLHIWNPPDHQLPHQGTVNEIHTHVFDMQSTVVRGKMTQQCYSFIVGSEWHQERIKNPAKLTRLYKAVYGEKAANSRLEDTGIKGQAVLEWDIDVVAGGLYNQPAFTFHDSDPWGCTVTVMEKMKVHQGDAYVLVPAGTEPDNSYDRATAAPEEWLWEAVAAAIA
jgi:hypothetical protein